MAGLSNVTDFLKRYKIGAIVGAALAIPAVMGMVSFLSFLSAVFIGGSFGLGDTLATVVNVLIGAFLGGGVEYLIREKLM